MADARASHEAYKKGDLEALKGLLGDPPDFPNGRGPEGMGENILEHAIYHSPCRSSACFSNSAPSRSTKTTPAFPRSLPR